MSQYSSAPPYYPRSSEAVPLIGSRKSSPRHQFLWVYAALIALLIVTITIAISSFIPSNDPLDPDVRDRIRREWDIELHQHQQEVLKRIDTQKRWRLEVEEHAREVEERRRNDEDERLRLNMFWIDLASHTCTTYGTREYTARLVNVPPYYNRRVEACMATSVKIHGTEYTPKWCEDHGPNNVIGHWEIDQHEPDCASYWVWYKDFGCISPGSGQRRIEHSLDNIPSGGDWKEFCATTPASFRGMHFMGAEFCFNKNGATWGHWAIDDESCK
ncbi:hypothetical protein EV702DRAFT_1201088 [Suillus placidus]|uniref:Uncharacterized protein n=1 Tax=Suillus placidus TaxID=48579 RepID=A0A9P6ZPD8_9AGAM|nr:hypothetical protein EV702DRAFT_1201088 [Suillus placidus]